MTRLEAQALSRRISRWVFVISALIFDALGLYFYFKITGQLATIQMLLSGGCLGS